MERLPVSRFIVLVAGVAFAVARGSELSVPCDMSGDGLHVGALYFDNDKALCEATCSACVYPTGSLQCMGYGGKNSTLSKCYGPDGEDLAVAVEAPRPASAAVNVTCDAVARGIVHYELHSTANNDDVTDDEEFCLGVCHKCDAKLSCERDNDGDFLSHCRA